MERTGNITVYFTETFTKEMWHDYIRNSMTVGLKDLQETSESNIQQLEDAFESLQKQIEVLQSELDSLNARHTE